AHGQAGEIEIAIDAIDDALATQGSQPFVDPLADRAELRISGIAQRKNAELDTIEARSTFAHEFVIDAHRPRGRLALAPRRSDYHQALGRRQRRQVEV